ncbi:MAG: TolC family protein [Longimicrobiales bacterium]
MSNQAKILVPVLIGVMAALPLAAQQADTIRLSLPDAVTRAIESGDEARLANAQVELADAQVATARASGLPQLRLTGNFNHVYENARANAVGQIFNQPNTYSTNANLSQTVFQGGRIFSGARAASRLLEAATLSRQETQARVSFDVQRAYLQVLFANRISEIQTTTYARAQAHLQEVERFEQAGRAARYDVLRARVQLANLEPQMIQAGSDQEISLLDLKRLINLPLGQPVVLTTTIDAATAQAAANTIEANDDGQVERPAVRAAELTASARHEGVKVARADFLPSVTVFLQSGFQAFPAGNRFPPGLGKIISTECPPGTPAGRSCIEHNGGWFTDRSMGVQFSWPLFDGLRAKGNYDVAQSQARIADLQLAQQREVVALEVAEARAAFKAAKSLFEARRQNSAEANEAMRLASLRFGRGLSTQLEVQDAQLAVMQAETNEARAIYDYYLAAAELARSLGEPPPLPQSGSSNQQPNGSK